MRFEFTPYAKPFRRWLGPFSPSRGKYSGLRVREGCLGAYVVNDGCHEFWTVAASPGVEQLVRTVKSTWGGGRVLLLPTGHVVKPLQENQEIGVRALIGTFGGALTFVSPDGSMVFDIWDASLETDDGLTETEPGDCWHGPRSIGLECVLNGGVLNCTWYHPTNYGRERVSCALTPFDPDLHCAFHEVRPGAGAGRVHVTPNGAVITNCEEEPGEWTCRLLNWTNVEEWPEVAQWIGEKL